MSLVASTSGASGGFDALAPVIVVLLVVGAALLFVMYTRAKIERRTIERGTARQRIDRVKSVVASEDEFASEAAEMVEVTRRLAAQLDTKAARLEQLMERAEAVIHALERVVVPASPAPAANGLPAIAASEPPSPACIVDHAAVEAQAREPSIESRSVESLAAEIVGLAEEGLSAVQIAQRLEEATGKVELILALRRQAQRIKVA